MTAIVRALTATASRASRSVIPACSDTGPFASPRGESDESPYPAACDKSHQSEGTVDQRLTIEREGR